jgi:hypothetical protein
MSTQTTLIAALLLVAPAVHAAAPAVPESLRACSRIQDSLQRLVCYDREIAATTSVASPGAAAASATPPAAVPAPPPVAAIPKASAAPQLGDELVNRKARAAADTDKTLTAGITALREERPGEYLITLDNGQLWRQQQATTYFPLNVGETVRIDKGALGSYQLTRLVQGSTRWVRVTRVK